MVGPAIDAFNDGVGGSFHLVVQATAGETPEHGIGGIIAVQRETAHVRFSSGTRQRPMHCFDDVAANSKLAQFAGRVSDSGEGRWTIKAAIDEGVPVPVLTTALYARFASRGEADFQGKLLSAMRYGFGGHLEKSAK